MSDDRRLDAFFRDRRLIFTGATGFLGKVTLALLLDRYPDIGEVLVVARRGSRSSAEERVFGEVLPSEPFLPLRTRHGPDVDRFLRQKIKVLEGDVSAPGVGISNPSALGKVDLVLNCAGLVTFDPSLELALDVNTLGALNAAQLAVVLAAPLVHVSTCFVAGSRQGPVFEDAPILGEYPRRTELEGLPLDPEAEIQDCRRRIERARMDADDLTLAAIFRRAAHDRLKAEGRIADDRTMRLAVARERKLWLADELVRIGMERARHFGWPNTYTFSKALAEQVVVLEGERSGLRHAIARPAIVESALRFPFPGWNEGFTTSAPLAFLGLKGHRALPAGARNNLDLIPVDLVAAAILGISGSALGGGEEAASGVYQLASGDVNPLLAARAVELVGLYRRRVFRRRESSTRLGRFKDTLASRAEMQPVSKELYELTSAPLVRRTAAGSRTLLSRLRPAWGAPRVQAAIDRLDTAISDVEKQAGQIEDLIALFLPFLADHACVFRCDRTRALFSRLSEADRNLLQWDPEALDWRHYFLDVHMAGLETWVFPGLERERDRSRRRVKAHRDLLELFRATTEAHASRVALRYLREDHREAMTYGRLRREAERVAAFLSEIGVRRGDRVILASENRPEWPVAYFGILLAGGVAVPTDAAATTAEIENIRRASSARAALFSDAVRDRLSPDLGPTDYALSTALEPRAVRFEPIAVAPDDPASLLFTSGTTGKPKGVLLSHRNFTQLVAKLQSVFDLSVGDGVLSVLPLHHTFEFSCGLLTPLAVGAEVTYLDELTVDRLGAALTSERIHAIVGVPALFQLLHRRLTQELAATPPAVERATRLLISANRSLRDRLGLNLGKVLFWPVHRRLGGHLKVLVSGGSVLSEEVHDAFRGLGFNLTEGYGLTEAAPVLAVTPPGERRQPGSVGKPLPGIELRIDAPDANGIGEVLARGPNVMLGYFGDPEATVEALSDGWLRTADLGFLDAEGSLHLAGRKKEIILDASGKNIYPDELEEIYRVGAPEALKEFSIVGLPDGSGGESVACLAICDTAAEGSVDEGRARISDHFRGITTSLPFTRRVKVLHIVEGALPRTATRKVRRPLVVIELQKLEEAARQERKVPRSSRGAANSSEVLLRRVAAIARRSHPVIHLESRLVADLGFDSLAMTELSAALEEEGFSVPDDLSQCETIADLSKLVGAPLRESPAVRYVRKAQADRDGEVDVPAPIAALGRSILAVGQRLLYERLFDTKVVGRSYVPQNQTFLVAANHTSHLDMGLIKVALGDQGRLLRALAARDYFFDTPEKRAYFGNFTGLIPIDRHGSLKTSLRLAGRAIAEGSHLLIFPEGTRSADGTLTSFKPTLGFLALTHGVGILPAAVRGTHEALPKGAVFPRARQLHVAFGPYLPIEELRAAAAGLPKSESYRVVTQLVENAIRLLLDGRTPSRSAAVGVAIADAEPVDESSPRETPALILVKGAGGSGNERP